MIEMLTGKSSVCRKRFFPMLRQLLPTMWNRLPPSDETHTYGESISRPTDVPKMVGMAVPRRPTFSLLDVGREGGGTVY